jgi:hypothetical protein
LGSHGGYIGGNFLSLGNQTGLNDRIGFCGGASGKVLYADRQKMKPDGNKNRADNNGREKFL